MKKEEVIAMTISDQQYRHDCAFLDAMCACRPHEDTPIMRQIVREQSKRLMEALKISPLIDEETMEILMARVNERATS